MLGWFLNWFNAMLCDHGALPLLVPPSSKPGVLPLLVPPSSKPGVLPLLVPPSSKPGVLPLLVPPSSKPGVLPLLVPPSSKPSVLETFTTLDGPLCHVSGWTMWSFTPHAQRWFRCWTGSSRHSETPWPTWPRVASVTTSLKSTHCSQVGFRLIWLLA